MGLTENERESFLQWCLSNNTKLDQSISFKSSEIEGTGVFLDLDSFRRSSKDHRKDEPVVVMRVPKKLSLSIDTIAQDLLTRQLSFEVEHDEEGLKQGKVLISFLSKLSERFENEIDPYVRGGLNETNILVGEIQTLMVLKYVRDYLPESRRSDLKKSPFAFFDQYLDLLMRIEVNAVKTDELYEEYKKLFRYNEREFRYEIEKIRNSAVIDAVKEHFPDVRLSFATLPFLRQVEMAVISRILEIPEPLNPQDEESTEEDEESKKGFAVASTMVPIIDFVNHSNDKVNAYFDADKDSGEILLKLDLTKILDEVNGEIELFIQYSDYEDTLRFIHSYGFIPKSHTISPLYELPISRRYLEQTNINNYDLAKFYKWFQIQPNVQFVISYDSEFKIEKLRINLDGNFIVFGFSKGLTYDADIALDIVATSLSEYGLFSPDSIQSYLALEESDGNDIIVDYEAVPFVNADGDVYENIEDLVTSTDDEDVDGLIYEFLEFLEKYSHVRLAELEKFEENNKSANKSSIVNQFVNFERNLLYHFIKQYADTEDKIDLIIGSEECDDEWLKLRLAPRTINNRERQRIFQDEVMNAERAQADDLEEELAKEVAEVSLD